MYGCLIMITEIVNAKDTNFNPRGRSDPSEDFATLAGVETRRAYIRTNLCSGIEIKNQGDVSVAIIEANKGARLDLSIVIEASMDLFDSLQAASARNATLVSKELFFITVMQHIAEVNGAVSVISRAAGSSYTVQPDAAGIADAKGGG